MWKRIIVSIAALVIVVSSLFLYRGHQTQQAHLRLEWQAAEMVWQEFLKQYQHDLPIGTARVGVRKYLDGQKALYIDGHEIMVKIGEMPDPGPVCDSWNIYVSLTFTRAQNQAEDSPLDTLTGASLKRVGHCL
jgi:type II secretory pathway component PulL